MKKRKLGMYLRQFKLAQAGLDEFKAQHKPKGLGRGLEKIDRIQREGLLFKHKGGMRYLPRDLGNANMKVVVHKLLNEPNRSYEHLSLNWIK